MAVYESFLDECLHGIAWEYVAQHSRDLSREMFCALISNNPRKFILDKETMKALRKKLFKKNNDPNWSEPCEPVDSEHVFTNFYLTCTICNLFGWNLATQF
ncbi:uncharacterized protein TNCT_422891 [Trichonephila clavata]|uniref:Uncharacterized protein n=1 Tax=Trichonephila clavata TaxID=2740835 RepID=A0A8X6HW30_TRICU|nr:uncharacterized protein TNCT_422891 [Trichonephila clavata]